MFINKGKIFLKFLFDFSMFCVFFYFFWWFWAGSPLTFDKVEASKHLHNFVDLLADFFGWLCRFIVVITTSDLISSVVDPFDNNVETKAIADEFMKLLKSAYNFIFDMATLVAIIMASVGVFFGWLFIRFFMWVKKELIEYKEWWIELDKQDRFQRKYHPNYDDWKKRKVGTYWARPMKPEDMDECMREIREEREREEAAKKYKK